MSENEDYQCRKCGKMHPARPKKCYCGCHDFRIVYPDKPQLTEDVCCNCGYQKDIKAYKPDLNLCDECAELLGLKRGE
ncbi:MAG: hypothetical protein KAU20_07935 [Nanoarchaeota archaeon]|nr:hypothetical protein [Nanoarchaeota archaeon]